MVMKNGRLSAKDFFADLHEDDEQKSDATRVSRPQTSAEESQPLDRRGTDIGKFEGKNDAYMSDPKNQREIESWQDAALKNSRRPESEQVSSESDQYYKDRADYYNKHLSEGESAYSGDDVRIDEAKRNHGYKKGFEQMQKVKDLEAQKKKHQQEKADTFERNLHKYDQTKQVATSSKLPETVARPKNRTFSAKDFFKGVK